MTLCTQFSPMLCCSLLSTARSALPKDHVWVIKEGSGGTEVLETYPISNYALYGPLRRSELTAGNSEDHFNEDEPRGKAQFSLEDGDSTVNFRLINPEARRKSGATLVMVLDILRHPYCWKWKNTALGFGTDITFHPINAHFRMGWRPDNNDLYLAIKATFEKQNELIGDEHTHEGGKLRRFYLKGNWDYSKNQAGPEGDTSWCTKLWCSCCGVSTECVIPTNPDDPDGNWEHIPMRFPLAKVQEIRENYELKEIDSDLEGYAKFVVNKLHAVDGNAIPQVIFYETLESNAARKSYEAGIMLTEYFSSEAAVRARCENN